MHILLAADQYPEYRNGAAAFTERLAAGLAGRQHTVTVAYPSECGPRASSGSAWLRRERFTSIPLPRGQGLRFCPPASARREADALLRHEDVDVVHVQAHLPLGRAMLSAAKVRGIPVVATNHFMPENLLPHVPLPEQARRRIGDWAWRDLGRVYRRADLVTTPTPRAAELLTDKTGLAHVEVISNGVDLRSFVPRASAEPSGCDRVVLCVGRLEAEKRVDDLLKAFAGLPRELGGRLVYIGTGSRRAPLGELAATFGIADRVEFWGDVDEETLRAAFAECAVFCAPGVAELQSLVTLEAVASGAPIVAADAVALPHLVHHGVNGFLYPPNQLGALTDALAELLTHPDLRRRMGMASRGIAQDHDAARTVEAYVSCYDDVLGISHHADHATTAASARSPERQLALIHR